MYDVAIIGCGVIGAATAYALSRYENKVVILERIISAYIKKSHKKSLAHTDILCQQTLRSKLLTFFEYIKTEKGKNTFYLPLPLSDLADYLSVDRSAMMREIKKMNEENIIISEKRKITVIEDLSE